jgi:LPXTG-motif cell wall-anchored protein
MTTYAYTVNERAVASYARSVRDFNLTNTYVPPPSEEPPTEIKKKPTYTPENWEELVTLLDAEVPLYGGLLKTGEETPLYPYVFGGLGLLALIAAALSGRRRRKRK